MAPVEYSPDEETGAIIGHFHGYKGVDTITSPIGLTQDKLPDMSNMDIPGGNPVTMDGTALHDTGQIAADNVPFQSIARHIPVSGTAVTLTYQRAGIVESWNGTAFTQLRTGLTTGVGTWQAHAQVGNYTIFTDPSNGNYKYDGSNHLPLGAKMLADFEASESWTNGAAETTTVREGAQARSTGAIAALGNVTLTLSSLTLNVTAQLLSAGNYSTTTDNIIFQMNISDVTQLDEAASFIRFQTSTGNYFQKNFDHADFGTLANGWQQVTLAISTFTETGTGDWTNITQIDIYTENDGASALTVIYDDMFVQYATLPPAAQVCTEYKSMILLGRPNANPSDFSYTLIGSPDGYNANATITIAANDGQEITGLIPYFDQVVCSKDNSIHLLDVKTLGTTYPNYDWNTRRVVASQHGCNSHRSMVEAGNSIFMWWQGGYYQFQGIGSQKISYPVEPTLQNRTRANQDRIAAGYLRELNQIWLSWPSTSATTNDTLIRFDTQEQAWLPNSIGDNIHLIEPSVESDQEFLLLVEATGRVLEADSGTSFDGSDITSFVTLPWVSMGRPYEMKEWHEVWANYDTGTGTLVVQYRTADHPRQMTAASYSTARSINIGAVDELGRVFLGVRSRWIQIRFHMSSASNTGFELFWPVTLLATPQGIQL